MTPNGWYPTVYSSPQVERRICELEELEMRVEKVWEETRLLYQEDLEIVLLQRELEQAERWLSSYESTLMAEEYGVCECWELDRKVKWTDVSMGQAHFSLFNSFVAIHGNCCPVSGYIFACSVLVMQINAEVGGKKISNIKWFAPCCPSFNMDVFLFYPWRKAMLYLL